MGACLSSDAPGAGIGAGHVSVRVLPRPPGNPDPDVSGSNMGVGINRCESSCSRGLVAHWVSRHLRCLGPRSAHPEVPAPTEHEWSTASMRGPRRASARVAQAVPSPHGPSRAGHEGGGNERGPWARPPQGERERQPEMSGYPAVAQASSPVKTTTKATRAGTPVPRLMMRGADTFATINTSTGYAWNEADSPRVLSDPRAGSRSCDSRFRAIRETSSRR